MPVLGQCLQTKPDERAVQHTPVNWTNVVSMQGKRLRRWPCIDAALAYRLPRVVSRSPTPSQQPQADVMATTRVTVTSPLPGYRVDEWDVCRRRRCSRADRRKKTARHFCGTALGGCLDSAGRRNFLIIMHVSRPNKSVNVKKKSFSLYNILYNYLALVARTV